MSLDEILILAVIQGITEFLPVSSSGHLVVGNAVLETLGYPPTEDLLEVNIVLHLGTLAAILVFYCREVGQLLGRDRRLIPLLVVGTIPAAVVGVPLKKLVPELLANPLLAGAMFPVTALLLLWAARRDAGTTPYGELRYASTIKIGLLQALALLPGISRSGATIAGGLACGLDRQSAGTFAFLLAIPAIAGAGTLELVDLFQQSTDESAVSTATSPLVLAAGAFVAMVVGLAALWWLVRWIRAGRLASFAWYLVPLGAVVVVWQLLA
jgi:undecaprenyl-diphosphatase